VPTGADYDVYVYGATPDAYGNPVIRASATFAVLGNLEIVSFVPAVTETGYLIVKRVSGSGAFAINGGVPVGISAFEVE
jgi:hypothetical protein